MIRTALAICGIVSATGAVFGGPLPSGPQVELLSVAYSPGVASAGDLTPDSASLTVTFTPSPSGPVGTVTPYNGQTDEVIARSEFDVQFRLTDGPSGQTGVVDVTGDAVTWWTAQSEGGWALKDAWVYPTTLHSAITLGANRYTIWGGYGPDQTTGGPVTAPYFVSVVPDMPEPGTLVLAAVGFLPLAGAAVRRTGRFRPV